MITTPLKDEIYKGSITYKDFSDKLSLPKPLVTDTLLDWRLVLMEWREKEIEEPKKIYVEYEIEATDQLLRKL